MALIKLIPIKKDGSFLTDFLYDAGTLEELSAQYAAYYAKSGFQEPWTGYLGAAGSDIVGTCGFKGPPANGKVEIAYFVFPPFEKKGYATEMARMLVSLARAEGPGLQITARTLPGNSASSAVLEKTGFIFSGPVRDEEDGPVWEWKFKGPGFFSDNNP